ncbi:hypothetical protein MRB53_003928 [Persea americana]|uniref:Uncharacterized protein n=1 Tax=Persea americana TaxID=3435 RepID=A0ACC2MYS8_PERAE|nr:hypothetical protein MRB53_003928 [Persea americana]
MSRVVQLEGNQTFISHFHFRYRGHFRPSSSSKTTVAIFPPFIFVDLSAAIWEIRVPLSSCSLLSLSAQSLPLSVARRDLWKLASSTPSLVDRALSPLHSLSRRSLSLGTASFSCVVSPDFEVMDKNKLSLNVEVIGLVPVELSLIKSLESLDLSCVFNIFKPLRFLGPDFGYVVGNLSGLRELYLDGVNISSPMSESLGLLANLTSLHLRSCNLIGEFPMKIFQLQNLETLDLLINPLLSAQGRSMREGEQQGVQKSSTRSGEHLEIRRDDAREAGSTERESLTREGVQRRESSIDKRRSAAGELPEISTSDAKRERSS